MLLLSDPAPTAAPPPTLVSRVPLVSLAGADEAQREQVVAEAYRAVLRAHLKCILAIDDDEAYRTILGKQLAPFCERVRATESPDEGMVVARSGEVDCVVLDLIMPEVDGLTLLRRMRDDAVTAHLPVVVCSSKALTAEEQALIRRLHAPFLPKDSLGSAQVARALLDARQAVGVFAREITESAA